MKKRTLAVFLCSALLCCATTAWAQAQMSSADLTGTVRDPAKAVLVGATVTATNLATNVTRSTTANTAGAYRIPLLPPGEYEVKAEKSGFATQVKRSITLTVGQTVVLDFDLQLGQVTTQVEVASSPSKLAAGTGAWIR